MVRVVLGRTIVFDQVAEDGADTLHSLLQHVHIPCLLNPIGIRVAHAAFLSNPSLASRGQ
jgi:hypothetical protein